MSDLRALSVRQPWAWAIANGNKDVENRSRLTKYRGPIAIHASLTWDSDGETSPVVRAAWDQFVRNLPRLNAHHGPLRKESLWMGFGAVIGVAEIVGCHLHGDPDIPCAAADATWPCSPWAVHGQWHWELANARPLPKPIPARGALGLWRMPGDVEQHVREFLAAGLTTVERAS